MAKATILVTGMFFILMTNFSQAQAKPTTLSKAQCEVSIVNIKKSIKKHKLNLRKQTTPSLSNIEKNIIRTALADLNRKVSVETCMTSEGKIKKGYLCMYDNTDIQDCRLNKSKDTE